MGRQLRADHAQKKESGGFSGGGGRGGGGYGGKIYKYVQFAISVGHY